MQVTIIADVTPENAPLLAQLLTGVASTGTVDAAVTPAPAVPLAAKPAQPDPAPAAPEPETEDVATPTDPTELVTLIRAKCLALKKAGKNQIANAAIKGVGSEKLFEVPADKYPELWEVLKNAG